MATSNHHRPQTENRKPFPANPYSSYIKLTAMLMRVVAPIGKQPRYRLWTGWRIIIDQMSGKRIYLAVVNAVKRINKTRFAKKNISVQIFSD
jgi:hypothetical protein